MEIDVTVECNEVKVELLFEWQEALMTGDEHVLFFMFNLQFIQIHNTVQYIAVNSAFD